MQQDVITEIINPKQIEPFEIADGINKEECWPLCIEIAKRYNNYNSTLSALKLAKEIMETYNLMKSKAGYEITEAINKAEQ